MFRPLKVFVTLAFFALSGAVAADEYDATIAVFKESIETKTFFDNAYGYAVFPSIGKGGIGVGGAYGKGRVYRGGKATGKTSVAQLSIGFQFGGEVYSEIIFFENKAAYDTFTAGNFEFSAQAQAVAITAAAQAKAGTTGASAGALDKQFGGVYESGMAVFTYVKGGLMYEASIAGQKFSFEAI